MTNIQISETLKNIAITQELKNAVKAYVMAKAYTESIKPTIESIQQSILDSHVYMISEFWTNHPSGRTMVPGRITKKSNMYLASDSDCNEYYSLCHAAYLNAGFQVEKNYCPLAIAETMEREAGRLMVDASKYIALSIGFTPESFERLFYKLSLFQQYRELIANLVVSLNVEYFAVAA